MKQWIQDSSELLKRRWNSFIHSTCGQPLQKKDRRPDWDSQSWHVASDTKPARSRKGAWQAEMQMEASHSRGIGWCRWRTFLLSRFQKCEAESRSNCRKLCKSKVRKKIVTVAKSWYRWTLCKKQIIKRRFSHRKQRVQLKTDSFGIKSTYINVRIELEARRDRSLRDKKTVIRAVSSEARTTKGTYFGKHPGAEDTSSGKQQEGRIRSKDRRKPSRFVREMLWADNQELSL